MINVLGTHGPTDGTDTLNVYGFDSYSAGTPNYTGIDSAEATPAEWATNDTFLLRSVPYISGESQSRPGLYSGTNQQTAGGAFVALLHASLDQTQAVDSSGNLVGNATCAGIPCSTTGNYGVERVNYDSSMNGGVHVYSLGGNDYFAVDDNAAPTYLDGGSGDNQFQIGQLYGLRRTCTTGSTADPCTQPQTTPQPTPGTFSGTGNLAAENVFDVATIATTRGWLSRGTSAPLVADGGTGNNTFTVYSNQAVVHLQGDGGNNLFIVRGFALAQTDSAGNIILPGGCSTISAPYCLPTPVTTNGYSTAATTDVRTGAGNNQVEYNMDAPVSVDGGTGFNKLIILGTEFADHIVVTDHGIFGAGMSVTYRNIQVIEIDALEGDDTIDVLSTAPGVAVRVIGGDGSNQINVAGDVSGNVYSQDILGTSSTINNEILTQSQLYQDLTIPGVSVNVAQASQGAVIITQHAGGTNVQETGSGPIGTIDSYNVRLAQQPTGNVYVTVTAEPDFLIDRLGQNPTAPGQFGDSILLATEPLGTIPNAGTSTANSDFYQHTTYDGAALDVPQRAVVLEFTPTDWQTPQVVWVGAINDQLQDGTRVYEISHSVLSSDPFFENAVVSNVEVTKTDTGTPGILVNQLGNTDTPGIYYDGSIGGSLTTLTSASANFTAADFNTAIFEIDSLGKISGTTTIVGFAPTCATGATTCASVTLSTRGRRERAARSCSRCPAA